MTEPANPLFTGYDDRSLPAGAYYGRTRRVTRAQDRPRHRPTTSPAALEASSSPGSEGQAGAGAPPAP